VSILYYTIIIYDYEHLSNYAIKILNIFMNIFQGLIGDRFKMPSLASVQLRSFWVFIWARSGDDKH
jgi:hypothetical protein